jgi:hypothetical protein
MRGLRSKIDPEHRRIFWPYLMAVTSDIQLEQNKNPDWDPMRFTDLSEMHGLLCPLDNGDEMHDWADRFSSKVFAKLGEFDEEQEFKLTTPSAETLRLILVGSMFHPVLVALDKNENRVRERAQTAVVIAGIKATNHRTGLKQLHRWLNREEKFDEDDYTEVQYPAPPLPHDEWAYLQQELIPQAKREDDSTTTYINRIFRYMHTLHYKLDYLLKKSLADEVRNSTTDQGWQDYCARFPWLARCDDHVKHTPNVQPMMLSRTAGVPLICFFALLSTNFFT